MEAVRKLLNASGDEDGKGMGQQSDVMQLYNTTAQAKVNPVAISEFLFHLPSHLLN